MADEYTEKFKQLITYEEIIVLLETLQNMAPSNMDDDRAVYRNHPYLAGHRDFLFDIRKDIIPYTKIFLNMNELAPGQVIAQNITDDDGSSAIFLILQLGKILNTIQKIKTICPPSKVDFITFINDRIKEVIRHLFVEYSVAHDNILDDCFQNIYIDNDNTMIYQNAYDNLNMLTDRLWWAWSSDLLYQNDDPPYFDRAYKCKENILSAIAISLYRSYRIGELHLRCRNTPQEKDLYITYTKELYKVWELLSSAFDWDTIVPRYAFWRVLYEDIGYTVSTHRLKDENVDRLIKIYNLAFIRDQVTLT